MTSCNFPSPLLQNFSNLSSTSVTPEAMSSNQQLSFEEDEVENAMPEALEPKETRIPLAAQKFDHWMKTYNGHNDTHAEELTCWLYNDDGGKLITTYAEFVELVTRLNNGDYDIPEVPSKLDFEEAMIRFARNTGTNYEPSEETRILRAARKFDHWVKTDHVHNGTDAEKLTRWLYNDGGGKLITTYQEFVELVTHLNSEGYDIPEVPSKLDFEEAMIRFARNTGTNYEPSEETRIPLAARKFDHWMKTYHVHNGTDAEKLTRWLYNDRGGKLITTYQKFVELATHLHRGEYDIPEVPSRLDFEEAMIRFARNTGTNYEPSEETRIPLAAREFDHWMKTYHVHNGTDAEKLTRWLYNDRGGKLITTYQKFVELATHLHRGEYDIPEVPSRLDFEEAMIRFARNTGTNYEPSEETRIPLAAQKFDHWMKTYNGHNDTHAEELTCWLYNDDGGKLITTYQTFFELATHLNNGEYDIPEAPSRLDFEKAIDTYQIRQKTRRY